MKRAMWTFFYLGISLPVFSRTLSVNQTDGGDFTEIQPAIDTAEDGDLVLVASGEYVVTKPITFRGKAITLRGTSGAERTTIRMSETPAVPTEASVVVFESGEGDDSVLEGFTLTGGQGTELSVEMSTNTSSAGGGVLCRNGSAPRLVACTITGNSADQIDGTGGGVACLNASPRLTDCTITGNSVDLGGGGVSCSENASPILTSCTISGNLASGEASGWGGEGGGLYCRENSSPILTDCTISENSASGWGGEAGGLFSGENCSPVLTGCTILENSGGGVYCSRNSSPILTGCTVLGNSDSGGLVCGENSSPIVTNCTIVRNSDGGVLCWHSSVTLTSSIVWDNVGGSVRLLEDSEAHVSYSCIENAETWPGTGNINADPLFCGGWESPEVVVNDQRGFEEAFSGYSFSLALTSHSPCLGTGEDGANIGADTGVCEEVPGAAARHIRLAAGVYRGKALDLSHRVSIEGSGEDVTVIEGTVSGLRTGATLSNLTVTGGTSEGIVVADGEAPQILNCTISGSRTGIVCGRNASPILTGCTISRNSGGGVYCEPDSTPALTGCTISGNSGQFFGGVSCRAGSSPILTSCTITGNSAREGGGGGVSCWDNSSPTLTNCTITGNLGSGVNEEWSHAGGVYCRSSFPILTNCTITGNSAANGRGVFSFQGGSPTFTNCIVWNNGAFKGTASITYSCIEHDGIGQGNINADPRFEREGLFDFNRFVEVEIGGELLRLPDFIVEAPDYHLRPDSPCIDSGTLEGAPEADLERNARPCGTGVDMGAYERGDCRLLRFLRGDCNSDGAVNISDATCILNWLFAGGETPGCVAATNTNGDEATNIADATFLLSHLFGGGPAPVAPFPDCGPGMLPADAELGCANPPDCQ